jgi:RNA polymerase sigma-70 factor (ECF subfamily)
MEEELIRKVKNKDKKAFNTLIENYKKDLYIIAKARLNNDADVEDAIQETLFKVYKNISSLKNEKHFKSWIFRILINNCNNIARDNEHTILYFDESMAENIPDNNNEYLNLDNENSFFDLISFLNEEEKTIISMKYSDEFDTKEISDILNIREGTIRMKISRIKDKIKNKLNNNK